MYTLHWKRPIIVRNYNISKIFHFSYSTTEKYSVTLFLKFFLYLHTFINENICCVWGFVNNLLANIVRSDCRLGRNVGLENSKRILSTWKIAIVFMLFSHLMTVSLKKVTEWRERCRNWETQRYYFSWNSSIEYNFFEPKNMRP